MLLCRILDLLFWMIFCGSMLALAIWALESFLCAGGACG